MSVVGVGDSGWAGGRAGGGEALKRFFTVRKKRKSKHKKTCCSPAGCSLLQMLNLFFIVIIILHGNVAVDDISAFYLPHFTFFMSFKDVFSPLCLSHCKKKTSQKRRKKNK